MSSATSANTKRDRLIESAAVLFHRHGMISTSLADIAKHAEIPIGNVYYYFKTKDELAMAALEKRRRALEEIYTFLDDSLDDPRERLIHVVRFFDKVKEEYARHGCPVYRMIADAGESDKEGVGNAAAGIYGQFVDWAERQFHVLGHGAEARPHALTLLAGIQGAAVMAKSFGNPHIMANEIERLAAWLSALPNKRIFLGKAGAGKRGSPSQDAA
ncbi:MAG: TetR/AcrR family transcriptional regulator [Alphaproteobacteria bacterium]|nr:TetR/AcrR family transcriptional regulator [Alphaproteobacteria bacterium]